jgi:L-serine dehydratase
MRAARLFALRLAECGLLPAVHTLQVHLLGSLGATGRGHASDQAVMLGLMGHTPDAVPVDQIAALVGEVRQTRILRMLDLHPVTFDPARDLRFEGERSLPFHPNAMQLHAFSADGSLLQAATWYSVGGGFVVSQDVVDQAQPPAHVAPHVDVLPLPFHSAAELLALTATHGIDIAEVMRRNEAHWRPWADTAAGLLHIWQVMQACIARGCEQGGILPGGFQVARRAPALRQRLDAMAQAQRTGEADPWQALDRVNLYALAVNEENAAGGRVVTAPTNGAAGIVPAVLHHHCDTLAPDAPPEARDADVLRFLLTAGAIGLLYKENASISGAEVGCQGEVGVACSMAAAGLCAVLGGSPEQVENAAEIGMEHHLGLTCDPVGGLVQIPCIERNAIAAVKAINAARLALHGDGRHRVSLDQVIRTMKETGADMRDTYRETARGGLAVNVVAC